MTFRDSVRMRFGLRPVGSWDPRPLEGAVRKADVTFAAPVRRLEMDPVRGVHSVPCSDPFATSGGYRLRRVLP